MFRGVRLDIKRPRDSRLWGSNWSRSRARISVTRRSLSLSLPLLSALYLHLHSPLPFIFIFIFTTVPPTHCAISTANNNTLHFVSKKGVLSRETRSFSCISPSPPPQSYLPTERLNTLLPRLGLASTNSGPALPLPLLPEYRIFSPDPP